MATPTSNGPFPTGRQRAPLRASLRTQLANSPGTWERAAALWSLAEACFWFIVPDVFLFASGVAQPERARRRALVALVFSLLGTVMMWLLCHRYRLEGLLFSLPLTYPAMADRVEQYHGSWGQLCAAFQAWSLIPVKVWTWTAVERLGWHLGTYLFWVGLGRAARMLLFTWLGCALGRRIPSLRSRGWALLYSVLALGLLYLSAAPFR